MDYSLPFTNHVVTADIIQRATNLNGATGVSKIYDGTTAMPSSSLGHDNLDNLVPGDTVTISGTPVYASANVGSRAIQIGSLALSGADANNYSLNWTDGSGSISQADLTISTNNDAKFVTHSDTSNFAGVQLTVALLMAKVVAIYWVV